MQDLRKTYVIHVVLLGEEEITNNNNKGSKVETSMLRAKRRISPCAFVPPFIFQRTSFNLRVRLSPPPDHNDRTSLPITNRNLNIFTVIPSFRYYIPLTYFPLLATAASFYPERLFPRCSSSEGCWDWQHGFRERRSCETQLIQLIDELARSLSSGRQTDLILLDFSKAFDKVSHTKLPIKLHQHGITRLKHSC